MRNGRDVMIPVMKVWILRLDCSYPLIFNFILMLLIY